MASHGIFHWNELATRDPEAAKKLYAEVAGWSFQGMPMPDGSTYWLAMIGEQPVAGIFPMAGPDFEGVPEHWMSYLAVDDVDAAIAKAKGLGASVLKEPFDIPGTGRIAMIKQPGGGVVGWMTPEA